jgi:tetratricopeptide (TPR) repeat protein
MLDVLEANELLERAEELHRAGKYRQLLKELGSQYKDKFESVPELAWFRARAFVDRGDHTRALPILQELRRTTGASTNDRLFRRSLNLHALVLIHVGELAEAERVLIEVSGCCLAANDPRILADAMINLGVIADIRTNWNLAIATYQRALIPLQELGLRVTIGQCHHNLGMSFRQVGRFEQAMSHFELALEAYRASSSESHMLGCRSEQALLAVKLGDYRFAEASARWALRKARATKNNYITAELLRTLGIILSASEAHDEARECLEAALALAKSVEARLLEAETYEELAVFERTRHPQSKRGQGYLDSAVAIFRAIGTERRAEIAQQRVSFLRYGILSRPASSTI